MMTDLKTVVAVAILGWLMFLYLGHVTGGLV